MNKYLKISRASYIFTLILLPLVVYPLSLIPYTLIKTLILSLGLSVSLIFFLASKPSTFKIPNVLLILLVFIEAISSMINPDFSLYPRYSEGPLVSILIFFLIFLGINIYKNLDYELVVIYSSVPVALASLTDFLDFNSRASGTFGQANFLGIFIVLVIISIINRFDEFSTQNKKVFGIYLIFLLVIFIKTASLASFFALLVGLAYIRNKIIIKPKNYFFLAFFISIMMFSFGGIYLNKIQDIYYQLFSPKQTIISDSFLIRKVIWSEVVNMTLSNPYSLILGHGPNSFSHNFEMIRGDILHNYSEKYLIFDKPHNYYLEIIFNYGIIFFCVFIYSIILALKNGFKHLIFPILIFLFFNWLDIYLKVLFYCVIFFNLNFYEVKNQFLSRLILIFTTIFCFFNLAVLFYQDTKFYLGDTNYIFSYKKSEILELKYQDPLLLIESLKYLYGDDKKIIVDYLLKNYSENEAVLFQLNKLL